MTDHHELRPAVAVRDALDTARAEPEDLARHHRAYFALELVLKLAAAARVLHSSSRCWTASPWHWSWPPDVPR